MDQKQKTNVEDHGLLQQQQKEIIALGPIPIYGQQKDIYSYRTEVYASLAGLLFLKNYAGYYSVTVQNKIIPLCDNKGHVNKLKYLIDHPKSIAPIHKMNESEAPIFILQNVPTDFSITHIAAYQVDNTKYNDLSVNVQLNVDADYLATKNITIPLNRKLESQPFVLYMNGKYLHASISKDIKAKSHEKEARLFLRKKYKWNAQVFQSITRDELSFTLNKQAFNNKIRIRKFMHHRLASGKTNFLLEHMYPNCKLVMNKETSHEHFTMCNKMIETKTKRIAIVMKLLQK